MSIETQARRETAEELRAEFATRLTTAMESAMGDVAAKLGASQEQVNLLSEQVARRVDESISDMNTKVIASQEQLSELSSEIGRRLDEFAAGSLTESGELVAAAKREMEAMFQVESDQRKLAEEKLLEALAAAESRRDADRAERDAAEAKLREELQKELATHFEERGSSEVALRTELNDEMSQQMGKQAELLGNSLEELGSSMEASMAQMREELVSRMDDEAGVLIASKEELQGLIENAREERAAENAELRAEIATQMAASIAQELEGTKDEFIREVEEARKISTDASDAIASQVDQLGKDVAAQARTLEATGETLRAEIRGIDERHTAAIADVSSKQSADDARAASAEEARSAALEVVAGEAAERAAVASELRAEMATQLASQLALHDENVLERAQRLVEESEKQVSETVILPLMDKMESMEGAHQSLKERHDEMATSIDALGEKVTNEVTERKVSVERLQGFMQGFIAASPRVSTAGASGGAGTAPSTAGGNLAAVDESPVEVEAAS